MGCKEEEDGRRGSWRPAEKNASRGAGRRRTSPLTTRTVVVLMGVLTSVSNRLGLRGKPGKPVKKREQRTSVSALVVWFGFRAASQEVDKDTSTQDSTRIVLIVRIAGTSTPCARWQADGRRAEGRGARFVWSGQVPDLSWPNVVGRVSAQELIGSLSIGAVGTKFRNSEIQWHSRARTGRDSDGQKRQAGSL